MMSSQSEACASLGTSREESIATVRKVGWLLYMCAADCRTGVNMNLGLESYKWAAYAREAVAD